jgi:hypothetical protein
MEPLTRQQMEAEQAGRPLAPVEGISAQPDAALPAREPARHPSAFEIANRPMAWLAPLLSIIVTVGFFAMLIALIVWRRDLDGGPDGQSGFVVHILSVGVGTLAATFATVMNFWFGSSQSSRNKDAFIADLQSRQAASAASAPSVVTAASVAPAGATTGPASGAAAPTPSSVVASEADFATCVAFVLQQEGGFVDNPADPGGATKYGITLKTLEDWRREPIDVETVKALTREEAVEIYRTRYWNAMRCGELPRGVDLMVLDCGVNAGPRRSILELQKAVGVAADGIIGPVTLGAVRSTNARALVARLSVLRLQFYQTLATWPTFGRGWTNRVDAAQRAALQMIG